MSVVEAGVPLLRTQGVSVRFGGHLAVDQVDLTVEAGRITGLIGPNGAGKTTIFNALCGLQPTSSGRVYIGAQDITLVKPHLRARRGLARTFQRLELFSQLTVRENVLVGADARRRWSKQVRSASSVDDILGRVGLSDLADSRADTLPTGKARLVELARALASEPQILLLDEPSSGLNEQETEEMADVLRQLAGEGLAILLVEHDMTLVMNVCEHIFVLDFGRIIAAGPPTDIQSNPQVQEAYLGVQREAASDPFPDLVVVGPEEDVPAEVTPDLVVVSPEEDPAATSGPDRLRGMWSPKSRTTAGVLGVLLGGFGVHRFYLGYPGLGVAQILVTIVTLGFGGIWGFVEGVLLLVGSKAISTDGDGRLLEGVSGSQRSGAIAAMPRAGGSLHETGIPVLELEGVRAGYGDIDVLHGVDLAVAPGEVFALLGPNGAGKSTTLKVICGQLPVSAGGVSLCGRRVSGADPDALARAGVCTVPEGKGIFPNLSVVENLQMATYTGVPFDQVLDRAFTRFPRLKERRDQVAGTMSGGEQQMLSMARALATDPALLLLDELSMGLAPIIVQSLYEQVQMISEEGISILIVEQFAHEVLGVADVAAIMLHGRVARVGSPDDIGGELATAYLGGGT